MSHIRKEAMIGPRILPELPVHCLHPAEKAAATIRRHHAVGDTQQDDRDAVIMGRAARAARQLTRAQVAQGARQVAIRTASGSTLRAEVTGAAPNYDLAVVRVFSIAPLRKI